MIYWTAHPIHRKWVEKLAAAVPQSDEIEVVLDPLCPPGCVYVTSEKLELDGDTPST